jgi:NAD(P)-dependent dehydrogenase (short-subunit alcohol dehydrogenase family)
MDKSFMDLLEGRRIIITGGASGMGAGLVAAFPRLDLDERAGAAVAANAQALGFCPVDVSKAESVSAAVGLAVERLQGLDVLVHAAGFAPGAPAEETSPELWSRVMAVNAMGTMLVNKAVFPHLKDRGGAILNFASAAGLIGYPGKSAYAASKGAVLSWNRSIAVEWGGSPHHRQRDRPSHLDADV